MIRVSDTKSAKSFLAALAVPDFVRSKSYQRGPLT